MYGEKLHDTNECMEKSYTIPMIVFVLYIKECIKVKRISDSVPSSKNEDVYVSSLAFVLYGIDYNVVHTIHDKEKHNDCFCRQDMVSLLTYHVFSMVHS